MFLNSPNDVTLYFKHTASHQRNRNHLKKNPQLPIWSRLYKIRWKKFYYSGFEIFINMFFRIGFAGFLCIEELLDVKLKHKITREPLRNFNPKIKNRSTYVVYISRIKSDCCPVKYLEAYIQKAKGVIHL